ncbi:hypothetical protein KR018_007152 [Drosophila ironensis]|nr:hypothetical protein KR018_007152 [Drosophila ironensis]
MRPPSKQAGAKRNVKQTQPVSESESEDDRTPFLSPEPADNETDYGLDFTTSQLTLQDAQNRRTSTLLRSSAKSRQNPAAPHLGQEEEQEEDSDEESENEENRRPAARRSATQNPQRSQQRPPAASSPQRRRQPVPEPVIRPPQAGRRKKATPYSRNKRMDIEIRRLQNFPGNLIPKLPFSRLVHEIMRRYGDFRITRGALEALQTSSELYLTQRLQDANMLTMHRGRVTLEVRDMVLMAYICDKVGR